MTPKLLFVGGSPDQWNELKSNLEHHFECVFLKTDITLLDVVKSWRPHLIVFYDQPNCEDGLRRTIEECNVSRYPVIPGTVVLAHQYSLQNENLFYQIGCDIYLLARTPVSSILNRLLALAKRVMQAQSLQLRSLRPIELPLGNHAHSIKILTYENIHIDLEKRTIKIDNDEIHLTPKQFNLLELFVTNAEKVLDRSTISRLIWGSKIVNARTIDAHIAKLKKALPALEGKIINVYGKGYRLALPFKKAA